MHHPHPLRSLRALSLALVLGLAACENPGGPAPLATPHAPSLATVPAQGSSTTLDVGNWNLEWFGDPANGPSDESLQLQNVRDVMAGADLDIWGVEEVVSVSHFDSLVAQLPGYAGLLANDPSVTDGAAYYSDFNNTEQKVGIVYRTSVATVRSARLILTANDYDFAGRPPLEVQMTVSLNGTTQDLTVIVLHAKAGSASSDWDRRNAASAALKSYLDATWPTQRVMVIGDWNDDVDVSIVRPKPSPYANFVADSGDYRFPTKALTDAGIASTVNYSDFIDHQLGTNDVLASYVAGSAKVLRADQYIASYGTTTSDHYPVLSRWTWGGGSTNAAPTASFTASCSGLTCSFTDGSSDVDGSVVSRSWTFGDGATSTATNPSHTYAAAGTYTVTETVTDDGGATGTTSRSVTVGSGAITLSVRGYKSRGYDMVDLSWSGAAGANVDVYRNGARITTTANDGAYTDNTRTSGTGTFTYRVCEAGTTTCSNDATAVF
jgi:PKD repeat protein